MILISLLIQGWSKLINQTAKFESSLKHSIWPLFYTVMFAIAYLMLYIPLKLSVVHHPYWIFAIPFPLTFMQAFVSTDFLKEGPRGLRWVPAVISSAFHAAFYVVAMPLFITHNLQIAGITYWLISCAWYWLGYFSLTKSA